MPKPKHVGTWVFVIIEGSLTKYGKDSDTEFPCEPDDKEAIEIAKELATSDLHKCDPIYIAHVFDNGQMKTFEFNIHEFDEHGLADDDE
jgi:hypothetical protein